MSDDHTINNSIPYDPKAPQAMDVHIGTMIQKFRVSRGFTRQDLAERLNITHQQLHKYERGQNRISVSRLADIAGILHIDVADFFGANQLSEEAPDTRYKRSLLDIVADFQNIRSANVQRALRDLIHALAEA